MPEAVKTVTGIPIEVLFSIIGALGLIVYADMRHQLRKLSRESQNRSSKLAALETYIRLICDRLKIPYHHSHGDDDS